MRFSLNGKLKYICFCFTHLEDILEHHNNLCAQYTVPFKIHS